MAEVRLARIVRIEGGYPRVSNDGDRYTDVIRMLETNGFRLNYSSPDEFYHSYSSPQYTRADRTLVMAFRGDGSMAQFLQTIIIPGL
jgi:hypothetical protein